MTQRGPKPQRSHGRGTGPGGRARGAAERARSRVTTLLVDDATLPFDARAQQAIREVANEVMAEALRPADLIALAAEAAAFAEDLAAEGRKMMPPERPIACRAGCGHCCHISVSAAPAEIFRLAEHIRNRVASNDRAALIARLRQASGMTKDERFAAYLPCPMLKNDSCSVYEARPLNCRGLESMDAEACRRASRGEDVQAPIYGMRWAIFNRTLAGFVAGTQDAGRGLEQLDLFAALLIALEDPEASRRWLAGEPVFESCRWPLPKTQAPQ